MKIEDKKTLLLVEDEVLIALSKQKELEKYGYNVLTINTGEKAVALVKENHEIDLILMDINLGSGIDGTEAAKIILKDQKIPVVFLSSHTDTETVEKTEEITSYGYVVKNSSITVLDASIKMAFKLFKASKQIREINIKQKAMLSDISDVIGIIGTDGIMKYKSPNIEKWFGWLPEELIGTDRFQNVHPNDLERIQKNFDSLLEKDNSTTTTVEYRYRCKDGSFKPIELTAINLINDPIINGVLLNYRDITERKQAKEEIIAISKFPSENPNPVLRISEDGSILFSNQSSISLRETWGCGEEQCIPDKWRQIVENVLDEGIDLEIEVESNERILSLFFTPVVEANYVNVYGHDITERKQIEEEFESIFHLSPDMVAVFTTDGKLLKVNPTWEKVLGYTQKELLDLGWNKLVHPDDIEKTNKEVEKQLKGSSVVNFINRYKCKDSSYRTLEWQATFANEGIVHATARDITNRKQTEENLRTSEERFRTLFETMIQGVIYQDTVGRIISANSAAEQILGLSLDQMRGRTSMDPHWKTIHQDRSNFPGETHPAIVALRTGQPVYDVMMGVFHPQTGNYVWININAIPLFKPGETTPYQVYTTFEDITRRKQTEDALHQSEKMFRELFEQAGDYIILWKFTKDRDFIIADANKAAFEFHGYSKDEFIGTSMKDLDKGLEKNQIQNLLERILSGESVLFETEHAKKDGTIFPIEVSAKHFKSEDGSLFIMAIERDITARKEVENALREEQKRMSAILSTVGDPIFVKDNDHRFLLSNRALYEMHGYKEEDVIGKTLGEQLPAEEMEHFLAVDRQVLNTGIPNVCEEHLTAKNGVQLTIITRKTRLLEESGKKFLVGSIHDITEIRQAEYKIKQQLSEKELILKETHHRIKNNFASIGSLLILQTDSVTNPEALSILRETIGRVNGMSTLYERLLLTDNYKTTSVKEYLDNLITDIINLFPGNLKVSVKKQIADFQLDSKHLYPVGIIVNELLTNTIKYAFTGKNSGLIKITLKERNGDAILTIQDDGIGLPEGFDLGTQKGFGLKLVDLYSQQLDGSLTIDGSDGTKSTLEFTI